MFSLFSRKSQEEQLNDKLNQKAREESPAHGSQGNPLINVRFREKDGQVDMRVTNADQLRNLLLDKQVKFSERRGYQTTHATHFNVAKADLPKIISSDDKGSNYTP